MDPLKYAQGIQSSDSFIQEAVINHDCVEALSKKDTVIRFHGNILQSNNYLGDLAEILCFRLGYDLELKLRQLKQFDHKCEKNCTKMILIYFEKSINSFVALRTNSDFQKSYFAILDDSYISITSDFLNGQFCLEYTN